MDRVGRRLLELTEGSALRRELSPPLTLNTGDVHYLSLLVERSSTESGSTGSLQVSLHDYIRNPRRRERREIGFGITSEGFPFIKCDGVITRSAPAVPEGETQLLVTRITSLENREVSLALRVYRRDEPVEDLDPTAWTVFREEGRCELDALTTLGLRIGKGGRFLIDELKIGASWRSVTVPESEGR